MEDRIVLLRVQDEMADMSGVHRFKLLLVAGSPIFAFTEGLVTTPVFHVACIDRSCDGCSVACLIGCTKCRVGVVLKLAI